MPSLKRKVRTSAVTARVVSPYAQGRWSNIILILTALALMLFSAISPESLSPLRAKTTDLAAPVLSVASMPFQAVASFVGDVSGLAEMRGELERLQEENARLRGWYQGALHLRAENQTLRELLNVTPDPARRFVTARVIADSGSSFVKSLVVLAGRAEGVQKGQAALSGQGLIGRVVDVGEKTSRILLIQDLNSRVPVMTEGTRHKAILSGQNSEFPALLHMPDDVDIADGARIVTSGDGGILPPGIPVGQAVKIDGHDKVYLAPFSKAGRVTHVTLVDQSPVHSLDF